MGTFLSTLEQFLRDSGLTASKFGDLAMGDPGFVAGIRNGRSPTLKTVDRVNAWMAEYRAAHIPPRQRRRKPVADTSDAAAA
jgi:hypothetical protein